MPRDAGAARQIAALTGYWNLSARSSRTRDHPHTGRSRSARLPAVLRLKRTPAEAHKVFDALAAGGFTGDWREPDVIRVAPVPLYNTFAEAWEFAAALGRAPAMSAATQERREPVTIVGAGLAGTLLATLLARRGHPVRIFERLPDMRHSTIPAGRSINLAPAARGIRALELAGVMDRVRPLLIPMPGRMLHAIDGALTFVPYGQGEHEVIYSVSRPDLNRILIDAAERAGVDIRFASPPSARHSPPQPGVARRGVRPTRRMSAATGDRSRWRGLGGSTCAGERARSARLRGSAQARLQGIALPAGAGGAHQIEKHALHVWPRGGFMLIALPNLDGSFTVTLFLPHQGELRIAHRAGAHRAVLPPPLPGRLPMLPARPMSSCCIPPASWAPCAASAGQSKIGCC